MGRDEGVYCNTCFDKNFALRCDGCNKTFKHGESNKLPVTLVYGVKSWTGPTSSGRSPGLAYTWSVVRILVEAIEDVRRSIQS